MGKPLVIYHDACADGFGAAFAAWLKLGDEAEYLPMAYGHDFSKSEGLEWLNPLNLGGREVYILDFSLPKNVMEFLFKNAKRVVWLDHHATSRPYAEEKCGGHLGSRTERHAEAYDIVHDNDKSGAVLTWEYFYPGHEVPMLIRHIDDSDRWQFKLEGTKAFIKALWSGAPWNFPQWKLLLEETEFQKEADTNLGQFIKRGEAILAAHNQNVQAVVKATARNCELWVPVFGGDTQEIFVGLAANCPAHLASDVGHELATQSGTFGLCWHLDKDGRVKGSLRSNGDFDVAVIARSLGGGGHKNAAGFHCELSELQFWLK